MAWIKLHQSLPTHRKTLDLADRLEIEPVLATGHVAWLWLWALDNSADGMLLASPRTIARVSGWHGDANAYVDALVASGFLERDGDGDGTLRAHDWDGHLGKVVERREQDAARKRDIRATEPPSNVRSLSGGHPADIRRTSAGTPPDVRVLSGVEKKRVEKSREDKSRADAPASPSHSGASRSTAAKAKALVEENKPAEVGPPRSEWQRFHALLKARLPAFRPTEMFWERIGREFAHLDLYGEAVKMVGWWESQDETTGKPKRLGTARFVTNWLERAAERNPAPRPVGKTRQPCPINPQHAAHEMWEDCPDNPNVLMAEAL